MCRVPPSCRATLVGLDVDVDGAGVTLALKLKYRECTMSMCQQQAVDTALRPGVEGSSGGRTRGPLVRVDLFSLQAATLSSASMVFCERLASSPIAKEMPRVCTHVAVGHQPPAATGDVALAWQRRAGARGNIVSPLVVGMHRKSSEQEQSIDSAKLLTS